MTLDDITLLRRFISPSQFIVMLAGTRGEEGDYFRAIITEHAERIRTMPRTYGQDGLGEDAIVYLHYFTGSADWYITEKDVETTDEPGQHQAFGLADLFGDGGELGYISILELVRAGVGFDLHWTPRTLAQVREKATA